MYEQDTPYVKPSQKETPTKSTHKHEYIRYVTYSHIRRFDGTLSEEKHRLASRPYCIDCGHTRRTNAKSTEVEVSVKEWASLVKQ